MSNMGDKAAQMAKWSPVIENGKPSKKAICRGNQFISEWGEKTNAEYRLVVDNVHIGFFATPEKAKEAADMKVAA